MSSAYLQSHLIRYPTQFYFTKDQKSREESSSYSLVHETVQLVDGIMERQKIGKGHNLHISNVQFNSSRSRMTGGSKGKDTDTFKKIPKARESRAALKILEFQ